MRLVKKMRLIFALFAFISCPAIAGDWTSTDTAWQVAFTGALALDCAQTRYGASHPTKFEETNPMMGKHPSKGQINSACALVGIGHYAVSSWLSPKWRNVWQQVTFGAETWVVLNNHDQGSKFEFKIGVRFK